VFIAVVGQLGCLETAAQDHRASVLVFSNAQQLCAWYVMQQGEREQEEEEGLQGVFKRLRRNGHQLEKGLQMAQRGPSLK
jgi:hypothetical protein